MKKCRLAFCFNHIFSELSDRLKLMGLLNKKTPEKHNINMNKNPDTFFSKTCSITGLPIYQKADWNNVVLGKKYCQSISVIGKQIILSRPVGFASYSEFKKDFELTHQVINEAIPANSPYIFITDLSLFKGFSTKARRYSIDHTGDYDRLLCLIFYQASPFMRFSINIAKRMKLFPLNFHFVKNYTEAVLLAQKILANHQDHPNNLPQKNTDIIDISSIEHASSTKPEQIIKKDNWNFADNDYILKFHLINGNIIHSIAKGRFKAKYLDQIVHIRQQVYESIPDKSDNYYYVIDVSKVALISFRERKVVIADLLKFYQHHPFNLLIFCGPNPLMRTAILLARSFVPFRIRIVKNFHDARQIIDHAHLQQHRITPYPHLQTHKKKFYSDADVRRFVDQSIELLGGMNWESGDQAFTKSYDAHHPFSPIFDAINLIKNDFEELLKEKQDAAKIRLSLENELIQARKMEAIGTLTGGIAHDFNNILSIILGNAELAADDVPENNLAIESLDEIQSACIRAKNIIQHLLGFARKTTPEKKLINMGLLVKESIHFLKASIPSSIEIIENIPPKPLQTMADDIQIEQVLLNLVTNAKQAMKNKGGQIEVSLAQIHIDAKVVEQYIEAPPGSYIKLSVKDNGCGIDPKIQERVFDPYFTTREVGKGSGIGLSIVHGIIKNHGGWIYLSSTPGHGSTFDVFLPAAEEALIEKDTADKSKILLKDLPRGSERILFIDDEASIVSMASKHLSRLGYHVISETDPVKALEKFRACPNDFDLVISDITMPLLSGDHLAREILNIRKDMPIVLCSGFSNRMNQKKADEIGIKAFAVKPVSTENLSRTIRRILDENPPALSDQDRTKTD